MPGPARQGLEQILLSWLAERFNSLSKKEILSMLQSLAPLHETRLYKEIFAEGEARGEARGEAKLLKHQLARRFGPLPDWAVQRIDAAGSEQIERWSEAIFEVQGIEALLGAE